MAPGWAESVVETIWRVGWMALPLVLVIGFLSRWTVKRPATRHAMWFVALLGFIVPMLVPPLHAHAAWSQVVHWATSARPAAPTLSIASVAPDEHVAAPAPAPLAETRLVVTDPINHAPCAAESDGLSASPSTNHAGAAECATSVARAEPPRPSRCTATLASETQFRPPHPTGPTSAAKATPTAIEPDCRPNQEGAAQTSPSPTAASPAELSLWASAILYTTTVATELVRIGGLLLAAFWRIPALPAELWIGGAMLLALFFAAHIFAFRRILNRAMPAPRNIQKQVAHTAHIMNLRHVPTVVFVNERISPLIWCGRRPRLVLPYHLWKQLDKRGRAAVVCHELAHLRRRDHWVTWIELLVKLAYWWNPLVWLIGRRLQSEADASCDAWVTWLLPEGRRAYAEALLRTREHVSEDGRTAPVATMGALSHRGKQLSRRLRMILTQSDRPRSSMLGTALVLTMAMVGWTAAPALSAQPLFTDTDEPVESKATAVDAPIAVVAPATPRTPRTPRATRAPRAPQAPAHVWVATPPTPPTPAVAPVPPIPPTPPAPAAAWAVADTGSLAFYDGDSAPRVRVFQAGSGEKLVQSYRLPKGKLDAFATLMARQDVPVLVSIQDDVIEVHGTPEQQRTFKAFVDIIRPGYEDREFHLPQGKMDAFAELMIREDVPIVVSPGGETMSVRAATSHLDIIENFLHLIDPEGDHEHHDVASRPFGGVTVQGAGDFFAYTQARDRAAEAMDAARANTSRWRTGVAQKAEEARVRAEHLRGLISEEARRAARGAGRAAREALRFSVREQLEPQVEGLLESAESMLEDVEELLEKADELAEQGSEQGNRMARKLQREAERLARAAERLQEQADQIREKLDALMDMRDDEPDWEEADEPRELNFDIYFGGDDEHEVEPAPDCETHEHKSKCESKCAPSCGRKTDPTHL